MIEQREYEAFRAFPAVTGTVSPIRPVDVTTGHARVTLQGTGFSVRIQISNAQPGRGDQPHLFLPPDSSFETFKTVTPDDPPTMIPAPARWLRLIVDAGVITGGNVAESSRTGAEINERLLADIAQTTDEMRAEAGVYPLGREPQAGDPDRVYRVQRADGLYSVVWKDGAVVSEALAVPSARQLETLKRDGEVGSIAELRLRTRGAAKAVRVLNYHAQYAGGGGTFWWDDTSTAADNGGTIIKPTWQNGPGRWRRLGPKGVHHIRDFGAIDLNQAPGYDSTPHIQAAIDALDGPRDLAMMYNDADKSGGVVISDPGEYGLKVSDRASTFRTDGTRTYNAVIVDQSHVVIRAESPKASVWKALGAVGQYDKMVTFRRTSWGGFDRIKLDGQDTAKIGLDIDLCDYFYSDRLFVAFTRIAGLVGCNLWESYFGAPTFLLTGKYSTVEEPGAAIYQTSRYRESPVHDAPDGAGNNTIFMKPTFSVYGSFYRCDEPNTANTMFFGVIAEVSAYPDRPATHEHKFHISGQNPQIHGMFLNQHHNPVKSNGSVFYLSPQAVGAAIYGGLVAFSEDGVNNFAGAKYVILNESNAGFGNVVEGLQVIDPQGKLESVLHVAGVDSQLRGTLSVATKAGQPDAAIISGKDVMALTQTAVDFTVTKGGVVSRLNTRSNLKAHRVITGPISSSPAPIQPWDEVIHCNLSGGSVVLDLNYYARWGRTVTIIVTGGGQGRTLGIATNGVHINGNPATYFIGSPQARLTLYYLPDGNGVQVVSQELAPSPVPATADASGVRGEWSEDGQYRYDCIADNTWRRYARLAW